MGKVVAAAFIIPIGMFCAGRVLSALLGLVATDVDTGLIATYAGIVAGVPVAIGLARWADAQAQASQAIERTSERRKVLTAIRLDLLEVLDELVRRNRSEVVVPFLRTDMWDSVSASEQITLLDDVAVLAAISRAYSRIGTTAYLERLTWEAFHNPDQWTGRVERGTGRDVSGRFRDSLVASTREQDPHTKAAIDVALERISVALGIEPPPNRPLGVEAVSPDGHPDGH